MKEIDKVSKTQPTGYRGQVLKVSEVAMEFADIKSDFVAYIDGADLVLCPMNVAGPGTYQGEYKYRQGGLIALPANWVTANRITRGTRIRKMADEFNGKTIIRLVIA